MRYTLAYTLGGLVTSVSTVLSKLFILPSRRHGHVKCLALTRQLSSIYLAKLHVSTVSPTHSP